MRRPQLGEKDTEEEEEAVLVWKQGTADGDDDDGDDGAYAVVVPSFCDFWMS